MQQKSPPARKLLHDRQIACKGYERDDGLWDIEAQLTDIKTYDLVHQDGSLKLKAGDPLHQLVLCITVDSSLTIVDARARTEHQPHHECPQISGAYAALVGMAIGPGFTGNVKKRFKGVAGCTHLTELAGAVATAAFQGLVACAGKALRCQGQGRQRSVRKTLAHDRQLPCIAARRRGRADALAAVLSRQS